MENVQKEIMNVSELASYIGVSKSKVYKLIKIKKVPASKIGRQYKFSKQVIDAWLKESIITSSANFPLFQPRKNIIKGGEKNGEEESSKEESGKEESGKEESRKKEKEVEVKEAMKNGSEIS